MSQLRGADSQRANWAWRRVLVLGWRGTRRDVPSQGFLRTRSPAPAVLSVMDPCACCGLPAVRLAATRRHSSGGPARAACMRRSRDPARAQQPPTLAYASCDRSLIQAVSLLTSLANRDGSYENMSMVGRPCTCSTVKHTSPAELISCAHTGRALRGHAVNTPTYNPVRKLPSCATTQHDSRGVEAARLVEPLHFCWAQQRLRERQRARHRYLVTVRSCAA